MIMHMLHAHLLQVVHFTVALFSDMMVFMFVCRLVKLISLDVVIYDSLTVLCPSDLQYVSAVICIAYSVLPVMHFCWWWYLREFGDLCTEKMI